MQLRRAIAADAPLLRRWDRKPHVMFATGADAADGDDGGWDWEHELPREVAWRELLMAEVDGRPVGVLQIIDPQAEETHYWGDVESGLRADRHLDRRGGGPGPGLRREMMRLALERCLRTRACTSC